MQGRAAGRADADATARGERARRRLCWCLDGRLVAGSSSVRTRSLDTKKTVLRDGRAMPTGCVCAVQRRLRGMTCWRLICRRAVLSIRPTVLDRRVMGVL